MIDLNQPPAPTGLLRIWWIPQVPMEAFYVSVSSVAEGAKLLEVLAEYDLFQFQNRVKGDYCNAGGLEELVDYCDGHPGEWTTWEDPETGEDFPHVWLAHQPSTDYEDAERYRWLKATDAALLAGIAYRVPEATKHKANANLDQIVDLARRATKKSATDGK